MKRKIALLCTTEPKTDKSSTVSCNEKKVQYVD